MKRFSLLAVMLGVLCCAQGTRAQVMMDTTPFTSQVIQDTLQTMDLSNRLRTAGGTTRRSAAARGAATGVTGFRPVAPSIMPARLAAAETKDPAERRKRQAFLEQRLRVYEQVSGQRGRSVKDLADAIASFIVVNYNTYRGDGVVTAPQLEAAREQLRGVYMKDPKFQAMTDRQKQEMYETAAIMGQFIVFGYDTAETAGNRQAMQQFKQMAKQNPEQALNTSVNNIHFTDSGIEIR